MSAAPQLNLTKVGDYTAINARPHNKWTFEQRVILAWLTCSYSNTWSDVARIFNACFKDELPTQEGLSENAIRTMRHCLKLQTDEKAAVAALQNPSCSTKSVSFDGVARALVIRTAKDLNIDLIEDEHGSTFRETKAAKPQKNMRKKRRAIVDDPDTSGNDSDRRVDFQPSAKRLCTPSRQGTARNTGLLSPPPTKKIDRKFQSSLVPSLQDIQAPAELAPIFKRKRLPRVAFRTFNPTSLGINTSQLFVAGAYALFDPDTIPSPPDPNHPSYRREAIRHVDRVYSGPTEFISVSRNLLRCLHRALKCESISSIAVIDLDVLQSLGRVQSASSLKLQVNHRYISTGEYLVHGTIPLKAIISCQSTSKLLQKFPNMAGCNDDPVCLEVLRSAPSTMAARKIISKDPLPFSDQSGAALGMMAHALRVPFRLMRHLCWSVTTDWKFTEARKWQNNEVFCSAVERGYRSRQSGRFMSLDTKEAVEFTDVEQSDSEYESEVSSETHDAIDNWKFTADPSSIDHQIYSNEFVAELHRAAGADVADIQSAETNWPFTSALDVPLIKQEREESMANYVEHYGEILGQETGEKASEEDSVNSSCRSTVIPDIGVLNPDSEDVYSHSWTGM